MNRLGFLKGSRKECAYVDAVFSYVNAAKAGIGTLHGPRYFIK
jgi:hypothetical protein